MQDIQAQSAANLTNDEVDKLLNFVKDRTGMIFAQRLRPWVLKQVDLVFSQTKETNISQFVSQLISGQKKLEANALFDSLTVNETMFFRDKTYFNFMTDIMFPQIIEQNRISKSIRIWIAAGSSGQEAYSILFLLHSKFPSLYEWDVQVLSTDLSHEVVEKGKKGIYEKHEIERGLSPEQLEKFFNKIDETHWQVKTDYRNKVIFKQSNLVDEFRCTVPMADFISCRNVLIYFNDETKHDIIRRLAERVSKNGFLLLGQVDYINAGPVPEGLKYSTHVTFPYYRNIT